MKTLLLILASLFIATVASLRAGTQPLLKAEVTGTVQTQKLLSPVDGRIHTAVLNSKRIFEEFQVSKADYELVFDLENSEGLVLLPKHTSAGLPTLLVVKFGITGGEVIDTKARVIVITTDLGTTPATNLFKNAAGEIVGTVHYSGSLNTPTFTKFVLNVAGSGTDTSNGGSGSAILRFKVTAKGVFNQAP